MIPRALLILLLCLAAPALAVDYTQDANCVGAWFLNGASACSEIDRSGKGNTLASNPGASYCCSDRSYVVPSGFTGTSRLFSFGTGYLSAPAATGTLNISGTDARLSIIVRMKPTSVPDNGVFRTFVSKFSASGNNRQYRFSITGTGSAQFKITGVLSPNGTATTEVHSATTTYVANVWYLVALTYDGALLRIYVDGDSSNAVSYTDSIASKAGVFCIGAQGSLANPGTGPFYGNVDEVAVFSRALTAEEVTDIYTNGLVDAGASDYPLYRSYCTGTPTVPDTLTLYSATDDSINNLLDANPTWYSDTLLPLSVQGRHIRSIVVPCENPTRTVLLNAGLHAGRERIPNTILFNMLHFLSDSGAVLFPQVEWVMVPLVNPDASFKFAGSGNGYNNLNGVNLNSNFNADWINADEPKGTAPESEPETQALARAIDTRYSPDLYIDLHSNANRIWVANASFVAYAANINPPLIANGFGPLPTFVTATGGWTGLPVGARHSRDQSLCL